MPTLDHFPLKCFLYFFSAFPFHLSRPDREKLRLSYLAWNTTSRDWYCVKGVRIRSFSGP